MNINYFVNVKNCFCPYNCLQVSNSMALVFTTTFQWPISWKTASKGMISWIWPPLHQLSSNGQFHRFGSPINAAWMGANFMNFATHNCLLVANFMDLAPNNFFLVANFMAFSWAIPFGPQQLPGANSMNLAPHNCCLVANFMPLQLPPVCQFHGFGPQICLLGKNFMD